VNEKLVKYQNHIIVALVLLLFGITIATAQYKVPSIMTGIMDGLSIDAIAASWLMSIFTFVGIILALPTGMLAKKFGPKNMLIAAAGIMVVGAAVGAFSTGAEMLIVSRGIEGVALIFTTICGPLAVQKYVAPDKIGSATGIWALWVCLGSVVGGIVTPVLYTATGFQGVWLIYAGATVVAVIILALFLKRPGVPFMNSVEEATAQANEQTAPIEKASYAQLIKPNTLLFLLGFLLFNLVLLAMLAFAPTFMQLNGVDPTLSGFVSTLPMLLAVISSPLFGYLADKTGKLKLLITITMLSMGPCAFVMLTNVGPMMWVAAIIMGLVGLGAPVMFLTAWVSVVGKPELMAIAMGLIMLVQSLGQFLGTLVPPLLLGADMSNWVGTGIVIMVLGFVGAASVFFTRYTSKA
jgi:MFS family permease